MSASEESYSNNSSGTDVESEDEFAIHQVMAYADEPLALPGDEERPNEADDDEDPDGLLPATLEGRYKNTVPVTEWLVFRLVLSSFSQFILTIASHVFVMCFSRQNRFQFLHKSMIR